MPALYVFDKSNSINTLDISSKDVAGVYIVTPEEFRNMKSVSAESKKELLRLHMDNTSFVNTYPNHYIGSLAIPVKGHPEQDPTLMSFYLDESRLVFVSDDSIAQDVFDMVAEDDTLTGLNCAKALFFFLNELLVDDLGWLARLEDEMEDIEMALIRGDQEIAIETTMSFRRIAANMESFYQEIGDIASVLSDDDSNIITASTSRKFENLASHCDRLDVRANSLKEYSVQLRDLYQTKLDMKQNYIMEVFTVVTVVIAPLTLVTGWFGMNISVPGASLNYMWIILLIAAILLAAGMVIFVRWKKWL